MPDINIAVTDKRPVCTAGTTVVCDNSDYIVHWGLDEEWSAYDTKTMRVIYMDGTYTDTVFTGDSVALPPVPVPGCVQIGLYAGDIHTSRMALLRALSSVRSASGAPANPTPDVYDQLMELIKGLGGVDPDDIAKAVADYLAAHPIEETDPTVPEWAKAKTKPTYSAAEVGAISQSDLQAATDAALAQAKASGEFDGPRGPAGAPGKDGAGMDITGATVGQIAKIAAVDASGVPTAWEPVDMPSGGGSNWEKVYDGSNTIAEEISVFEVDLAKNDPMKEFQLWLKLDQNMAADWGAAKDISVTVNGETIGYFFFSHRLNTYVEFYEERSLEAMTVAKRCMSVVNLSYNVTPSMWMVEQGVKRQNNGKLSISFPAPYAGKITAKVYGRY
jgi:hypothetical protein